MALYSVNYQIINQKTNKPSGYSGTIISASNIPEAKHIFKCSPVANTKVKYEIVSVKLLPKKLYP